MAKGARKPSSGRPGSWRDDLACPGIVVSCNVCIARNVAGTPFPETLGADRRRELRDRLFQNIRRGAAEGRLGDLVPARWEFVDFDAVDEAARNARAELGEATPEMVADPSGRGLALLGPGKADAEAPHMFVRFNDGDHLRFCGTREGCDLEALYAAVGGVEAAFDGVVADYAFDSTYGYLTPGPEDVGTGLRLGAELHLPGLRATGDLSKVFHALERLGLETVGYADFPDGTLFTISNLQTLGEDETRILERTDSILQDVAIQEDRARLRLAEAGSPVLADCIGRACGIALNAAMISVAEARELLQTAVFAEEMGFGEPPRRGRSSVDMDVLLHPEAVRRRLGKPLDDEGLAVLRAREIRSLYSAIRWR